MKRRTVAMALFHDALYQVLDNKVFRILLVFTFVLVAIPWVIGFREDEVVIAWGWRSYLYEDVLSSLGWMFGGISGDDQERMIRGLQSFLVNQLAGTFGIFFSLAATAFFVPRLLEKGAADPLFSKPVSRLSLLLSRYVAGLLFIAGLSTLLVGGIYLGFLVNSGFSDPTFLWTIPIQVYTFGLLFSFTVLVGVWTRSATASLLLSFVFFAFTGGVHLAWKALRMADEEQMLEALEQISELDQDPEIQQVKEDVDGFTRFASRTVSVLHHTLPKTSDAAPLAVLVRTQLETPPYTTEFALDLGRWQVPVGLRQDGILEFQFAEEPVFLEPDANGEYEGRVFGREVTVAFAEDGAPTATVRGEPAEILDPEDLDQVFFDPNAWYANRFGWQEPWRYNAWYSLASSLAFVAGALGLGWLRLRRINF